METRTVESAAVGRPPSEKPRNVQVAFRVDQETADRIDAELGDVVRDGLPLSRNDRARILLYEALNARREAKKKPRK
jgi:hypothetical protein